MCGRFSLSKKVAELEKRFNAKASTAVQTPLYNIAPTHQIPVITNITPSTIDAYQWGLLPSAKGFNSNNSILINARAETVLIKGMFKRLATNRRCLVLADGYIEWKLAGGIKIPYLVRFQDYKVFAFAGIYDSFETIEGELKRQVCILTMPAQPDLSGLHERMPMILNEQTEKSWLLETPSTESMHAFMSRTQQGLIQYPISQSINKDFNNAAELLEKQVYNVPVQGSLFG